MYDCDPEECESCIGDSCEVCGGDTNMTCCNGDCCDPALCESCINGSCVGCDPDDCETCGVDGECEDSCPPLGLYCVTGNCVECRDISDCELCELCMSHECVHPCDLCYWPKYCGYACACVECYPGPEDTTKCSGENSTTECDCSQNILNPCGGVEESVVYSGASLTSCTGPDCSSANVLCYTTYQSCRVSTSYTPLLWCVSGETGPQPPAPWPKSCTLDLSHPGPGCWDCTNSYESGVPTYEPKDECPTEAWP